MYINRIDMSIVYCRKTGFNGKIKIGGFASLKYRRVNIVRIIGCEKRTKDDNPLDFFRPGQASDDILLYGLFIQPGHIASFSNQRGFHTFRTLIFWLSIIMRLLIHSSAGS